MRFVIAVAALAAVPYSAFAQGAGSAQAPASGGAQAQAQSAASTLFPCRTNTEICFVGVALPNNQVNVLYTNHDNAEAVSENPLAVSGANGASLDLSQQVGRVVMLTGTYDGKTGLTKAEIIDTGSPLVSFAVKALLAGDDSGQDDPEPVEPSKPQRSAPPSAPRR